MTEQAKTTHEPIVLDRFEYTLPKGEYVVLLEKIMGGKQSQYIITYDDFNDLFLCIINGETVSANFVGEILSYIAKLYDFEPKIIYSESHYAKVLENELNIVIEIKD